MGFYGIPQMQNVNKINIMTDLLKPCSTIQKVLSSILEIKSF
jgi:hypothetical protein